MAQLSDDCFAFDGPLIPVDDALAMIVGRLSPVAPIDCIPVVESLGRVLAEDIRADYAVPPYDNSAVDGFAVFHDDLDPAAETVLPVVGRVAAGQPLGRALRRGEAVQIFTGAPMPDGPDTVMMLEDCRLASDGKSVAMAPGIKRGANRRLIGDDVQAGSIVLQAGTRLRPQDVGMLAACGRTEVSVRQRLSVALFSTGDEIREPGQVLDPGSLYDSNRFTIGAALRALGCTVEDLGILPDDPDLIRETLRAAADRHAAILTSGGMSMGEEDHMRGAVEALGSLNFWRVAIKPGRPVGMGLIRGAAGGQAVTVGLPGNPVAALTTFITLARPVLQVLGGETVVPPARYRVCAAFDYRKKEGRREYVRVRLDGDDPASGLPKALKHGRSGAGVLSSLVGADGFVELPEDSTYIEAGTTVAFLPFSEVF